MAGPATGRLIANRYALRTARTRGEVGTVWHAQDTLLGREVVVTQVAFPPWLAASERRATRAAILRETGAVARLQHPGAVTLFDVVADHDGVIIVTELVQAPTLADLVLAEGPLPPLRVAEIGAEVAGVLEAAHRAGIVHRDVKPAKVIVQQDGGVRLAGFGVTPLQGVPPLAATALALGSPSYVAPEQATGRPSGPAADMWGLGATMFFAVEGEPPFDKGTLIRTLAAVVDEDPRPMVRAGPLAALLTALLAKHPDDRLSAPKVRVWLRWLVDAAHPAPASEVLPAQPEAAKRAPSIPPPSDPQPARTPVVPRAAPVRRRAWGWLAGVLALLVVGGLVLNWLAGPLLPDSAGEEPAPPSMTGRGAVASGTTRPAPSTTTPATSRPPSTVTPAGPASALPAGWRTFTNRAGNSRVGVPPGFRVRTRQRYHATVLEEQGGTRRVFTVRSQTPSAPLPQASRDYRAWARRNLTGFREVRYDEGRTYAGHGGAVVFEYQADTDGRRVQVRHINLKGRTWGYNVEFIAPTGRWNASQRLARHFEQAFQPLG